MKFEKKEDRTEVPQGGPRKGIGYPGEDSQDEQVYLNPKDSDKKEGKEEGQ